MQVLTCIAAGKEKGNQQARQCGKTADWLFISRVLALSADQSKAAQVN